MSTHHEGKKILFHTDPCCVALSEAEGFPLQVMAKENKGGNYTGVKPAKYHSKQYTLKRMYTQNVTIAV